MRLRKITTLLKVPARKHCKLGKNALYDGLWRVILEEGAILPNITVFYNDAKETKLKKMKLLEVVCSCLQVNLVHEYEETPHLQHVRAFETNTHFRNMQTLHELVGNKE